MADVKAAFYKICRNFSRNRKATARVATGPSCEQWINAEIYRVLNWGSPRVLKAGEVAWSEYRKRDITIGTEAGITHVLEVKLLYPGFSEERLRQDKLFVLREQVRRARKDGSTGVVRYVGLVIALWVVQIPRPRRRKYERSDDFFDAMEHLVESVFDHDTFTTQHLYSMEPMVPLRRVGLEGKRWEVEIRGLYVTRRLDKKR
jgi:hypothetical protein